MKCAPRLKFCPCSVNRETPTGQPDRGLSQTAARMLSRALSRPRGVAWRSAASWDNSRSGAKADSWPVRRSERNKELSLNRSAGLRPGSFRFTVPKRGFLRPWELPTNPRLVGSTPERNLSLSAARGRDIVLPSSSDSDETRRCPRRPAQRRAVAMPRSSETPTPRCVSETAQRAVPTRSAPGPFPLIPRETPTGQPDRGLSQTAARMLARALSRLRGVAWRSAASWDNSRSGAKADSWPVRRSQKNKELSLNLEPPPRRYALFVQ